MAAGNNIIDLITKDYLSLVFAYALKRTNSIPDAEDLAQDILTELIASAGRLRNPQAYLGFVWAVANNTYKRRLRNKKM